MKTKKFFLIGVIIIIIAIAGFFIYSSYNSSKTGNTTINKTEEQLIQDVLNISFYKAKLKVKVTSNKNENQYIIKQEVNKNVSTQEVLQPENISGIVTTYENGKLTLFNSKLNLSQIYEEYSYIANNDLWLNSFVKEYKENEGKTKISYEGNNIILEVQKQEKYHNSKKLYIDKKSGKPVKLIVQDNNQKETICIEYTELEIL